MVVISGSDSSEQVIALVVGNHFLRADALRSENGKLLSIFSKTIQLNADSKNYAPKHSNYYYLKQLLIDAKTSFLKSSKASSRRLGIAVIYMPSVTSHEIHYGEKHCAKDVSVTETLIRDILKELPRKTEPIEKNESDAFVDKAMLDITLNGYSVSDYSGKSAKSIGIGIFEATPRQGARKTTLHAAYSTCPGSYFTETTFGSVAIAKFGTMTEYANGLAIFMTAEDSLLVFKKAGKITSVETFSLGEAFISKMVSKSEKVSQTVATSYLSMLASNELKGETQNRILLALTTAVKAYINELNLFLTSVRSENIYGGNVVIFPTSQITRLAASKIEEEGYKLESYVSSSSVKKVEMQPLVNIISEHSNNDNLLIELLINRTKSSTLQI